LLPFATMPSASRLAFTLLVAASTLGACEREPRRAPPPAAAITPPAAAAVTVAPTLDLKLARRLFQPLPSRFDNPANPATPAKIALGRMLYFEPRLSKAQDLSCASCHRLDKGGVDNERFSKGHRGQLGGRNAPTVFNAAGQLAQFWDGRAPDVEAQATGPVLNPVEMAMPSPDHVLRVLRSIPGYVTAFAAAFPGQASPITPDNFGRAIGAFERGLVTPTRFDDLLAGNDRALDASERDGLARFISVGCVGCHAGVLVGGAMYMKLGLVQPYATAKDQGRFDLTKLEADRMFFKVPSLRNVADTAPYFHDGSIADLPTAVREMGRLQLGKVLGPQDVGAIVLFLRTLSGAPPKDYVVAPRLPTAGPKTPRADPS
jgi:cytochrome c peroxidase